MGNNHTATSDILIHEWPNEILRPKGLVGDVADWILQTAGVPQPKFALAAALTTCGTLIGRYVKDYTGQRTNLFCLAAVPSSGGKDHPFKCSMKLIDALERNKLLAGEVTSDSALETLMDAYPVRCLFLDEVGDYLGSIKTAGQGNPFLKTVVPRLKSLWSAASGTYVGKTRAPDNNGKWHEAKRLVEPHISVYGTGAPSRLFECMTERDFDDGSIPRFITFISEIVPMRVEKPEATVPESLLRSMSDALMLLGSESCSSLPNEENKTANHPAVRLIEEDLGAAQTFEAFEELKHQKMVDAADDPPLYLWGKAVENARRIALTVSCFRNPQKPIVESYDAQYAVKLMTYSINEMIGYVRENVAATEKERAMKKVERVIRRAGPGGISQSDLTRKTPSVKIGDRIDALTDLKDAEIVVETQREGTGKKKVRWYHHIRYYK